ncbi:hypothetical protein Fmac_021596 [Flemingia macrophylla]|uniref:Uncharacterized protein n=1 Tax=Flemingia macrophylla TaxID=520843 RepID=A0ABD1LXB9_9FABA
MQAEHQQQDLTTQKQVKVNLYHQSGELLFRSVKQFMFVMISCEVWSLQLLGFENFIPPFANTSGSDILKGVNYASGSAGIRPDSGTHMGANINLGVQMINHRVIYSRFAIKLGGFEKAKEYLNKCLYYINIGSNDYINNYFLPQFYATSRIYTTPDQYANNLILQLSQHIQHAPRWCQAEAEEPMDNLAEIGESRQESRESTLGDLQYTSPPSEGIVKDTLG